MCERGLPHLGGSGEFPYLFKKFPLMLLLFLLELLTQSFFFAGPAMPHEDGLVAYYSFNRCDARDDSGGESEGILHGQVGCWCGIEGDGLLFDGMDDWVAFSGRVNRCFSTTDFTVSFYIKPEGRAPYVQDLLSKRAGCGEEHLLDMLLDPAGKQLSGLIYESATNRFQDLQSSLPGATWMHVALVREGQEARLYIDGERRFEAFRCRGVDIGNSAALRFSNNHCNRTRPFKGVLDELRIYDRALDDGEMRRLYLLHPVENAAMDCLT